jgi:hypothetical protein
VYTGSELIRKNPITCCGVGIKCQPLGLGDKWGHSVGSQNLPHCNLVMPVSPLPVGFHGKEKVKSAVYAWELAAGADLCGISAWWNSPFPMHSRNPRTGEGWRNRWLHTTRQCDLQAAEARIIPRHQGGGRCPLGSHLGGRGPHAPLRRSSTSRCRRRGW